MNKISFPILVTILIVAFAGFAAGIQYQKTQLPQGRQGNFPNAQRAGQASGAQNRFGGFRPVTGEITSSTDTSVTVKTTDGSSKIILLSTAPISNTVSASKTDLKTGTKIMVVGTENSDGSITATSLQLNPLDRMMGRPSGSPSISPQP